MADTLDPLRDEVRRHYLTDEAEIAARLLTEADIGEGPRARAQREAAEFVESARRNASRSGLIDKFLQEYGLSTAEGVTLMRLAEALLRTPDATTADSLIRDKVEAGDWAAHRGKSPFPLVNFSTRALMLTAAWLDDVEAKDPGRRIVKATKDILDRVGEPVIRASVAQAMKIMGQHFVLGETIEEALTRGRGFARSGYSFSFDMLGEAAHTAADAERYFDEYSEAITAIAAGSDASVVKDNPGISVKLSALHPRYEYAKHERVRRELGGRVRDLALQAKKANIGFNIDAEESWRLDLSLDLIADLAADPALAGWDGFGVVVQAYQRRAPFVIDWLAALARQCDRRIMVRLVKGAYWDSEIKRAQVMGLASYPVFTRKVLTDISFQACARKLFANADAFYPQFATHNALTASLVREMAGDYSDYELQRLHGMGEALHDRLLEAGARSRIYAPVGGHKELLPYLVRRLLENGANSSFVNQLIDPDLAVEDVVADPVIEARTLTTLPNPAIPAPRDLFNGARLQAEGFDPSEPAVAAMLEEAASNVSIDLAGPIVNGDQLKGDRRTVANPSRRGEIVGEVEFASSEMVNIACTAALEGQPGWAATPAAQRAAALQRAADALEDQTRHFIALAVREAGKSIPDAIAEVREAVDFLRYYANETPKLEREPLGVVACISPWNFPLAIFLGQVSAALAAGNAVIAKPAEQTSLIAVEAVRLLHKAGVPADALHCLPGDGPNVGAPLAAHPAIAGVVFTGSTDVAQRINRGLAAAERHDAVLIAETGGINAMIVDSTALLEQAVTDAVASAFQSAGQRCSACRLVCVQEDIADRFIEMLSGAMAELSVGDPSILETDVGPVIDDEAARRINDHISLMEREARIVARAPAVKGDVDGAFIRPIAFELRDLDQLKEEIFGPVLHVVRYAADELERLVERINAFGYGLTLGIHTRIDETMHEIVRHARVGNVYVNRNQIGAVVGVQPFGGEGLSGTGPKAGGPHYLPALTKRPTARRFTAPSSADSGYESTSLALDRAAEGFTAWHAASDRVAILDQAASAVGGEAARVLSDAARLAGEHYTDAEALPGPTGESNTLRHKGRGVALCLGPDEALSSQIAICLAAGNAVIATAGPQDLAKALEKAGFPGVFTADRGALSDMALTDPRIRCVVCDRDDQAALATTLARRNGPILALLTSRDEPWRFAAERTLTINTTAAGGDVRLLSLAE